MVVASAYADFVVNLPEGVSFQMSFSADLRPPSSITVRKNQWHQRKKSPENGMSVREQESDADQRRWAPQLSSSM